MAFRLARRSGSPAVTAMPLGLDTPSTFGMVFFVLGPAFQSAQQRGLDVTEAATSAWHIGIWSLIYSGLFKLAWRRRPDAIRRSLPRAGLLGSLAAIALVLISFLPLLDILHDPIVGLAALVLILTTLVARVELPWGIPVRLAALVVGTLHYLVHGIAGPETAEVAGVSPGSVHVWFPTEWLAAWRFHWLGAAHAAGYLPVVIPFCLATVVGGIDCTESAAAAGDEFDTPSVIAVEAVATLAAALVRRRDSDDSLHRPSGLQDDGRPGGLHAGHGGGDRHRGDHRLLRHALRRVAPGGRVSDPGVHRAGNHGPEFAATPQRHYPAVALACVPALAYLAMMFVDSVMGE